MPEMPYHETVIDSLDAIGNCGVADSESESIIDRAKSCIRNLASERRALRDSLSRVLSANPTPRVNVGAPGSFARLMNDERIAAQDEAQALLRSRDEEADRG